MNLKSLSLFAVAILSNLLLMAQKPIDKELTWEFKPEKFSITSDYIEIETGEHTNIFNSPNGRFNSNNAPRLLFEADTNFIFSAKVEVGFQKNWDGGVLFVDAGNGHYAKLCFERDYRGDNRIVSVIKRDFADDCNSDIINSNVIYLQVVRRNNVFNLYYSNDGDSWYMLRAFNMTTSEENVRIGFMAQSPAGIGCKVRFSEINYLPERIKNHWQGK